MKALLFSDLHTSYKNLSRLMRLTEDKKNDIGLLVFAGDVVNLGEPVGFVEKFINEINSTMLPFIWVPGNNDFGRSYHKLNSKWQSVEGKIFEFKFELSDHTSKTVLFTGVGGSPASWSGQYAGESMVDRKKIANTVFISHYPPPGVRSYQKYDSADFFTSEPQSNVKKLSDSPLVHISGHLHHRWGISRLGTTKIVQLAASSIGCYAIMDLETLKVDFKEFHEDIINFDEAA